MSSGGIGNSGGKAKKRVGISAYISYFQAPKSDPLSGSMAISQTFLKYERPSLLNKKNCTIFRCLRPSEWNYIAKNHQNSVIPEKQKKLFLTVGPKETGDHIFIFYVSSGPLQHIQSSLPVSFGPSMKTWVEHRKNANFRRFWDPGPFSAPKSDPKSGSMAISQTFLKYKHPSLLNKKIARFFGVCGQANGMIQLKPLEQRNTGKVEKSCF